MEGASVWILLSGKQPHSNMGALGPVFGVSLALLGPSWRPLLRWSWGPLAGSCRPLGRSWGGLGGVLGALGAVLGALGRVLEANTLPKWRPRGSKMERKRLCEPPAVGLPAAAVAAAAAAVAAADVAVILAAAVVAASCCCCCCCSRCCRLLLLAAAAAAATRCCCCLLLLLVPKRPQASSKMAPTWLQNRAKMASKWPS